MKIYLFTVLAYSFFKMQFDLQGVIMETTDYLDTTEKINAVSEKVINDFKIKSKNNKLKVVIVSIGLIKP